jgi:hypothetical protein
MKKNIFNLVLVAIALVATSCQKEWSEEIAAAQHEAVVNEWHVRPVDGTYANAEVQFRCIDSFTVDFRGQHYESTHYCHSTYRIYGGDVEENVVDLNGCYDITPDGSVANTNLYLNFVEDKVESAIVNIAGIPDPVDYSNRFRPCHYTPFQICFDTEAKKIRVYGVNEEEGDTCVATGDWYGLIVKTDTVWQNIVDTVFVWQHDTVIRVIYDTVVLGGDTTSYMSYITKSHKSWDGINGGYIYGTDSVKLTKMDADGAVLSVSRGTYSHRTPVTYNVPTMASAVAGNCYTFNGSTANCAGTNATCTLGATQVVGPVVLDGVDITAYLQGCTPYAQRICFSNLSGDNGTYTIYIVGHDGEDAGTITGPYSISDGRHLVSTDTTWNCGSVTAANYSNGIITYSITRTGTVTRHYSAAPLNETSTISGSTTYTYNVATTGVYTSALLGTTVNVNSNTANFSGFSVTMTPGAQNFCSHVHTTVTATSTGLVVNGEYNGSTTTVTIPMTPATVIDLEGDLEAAYISDSYTGNCLGRTTWLNLLYTLSDGSHVMYQVQLTSTAAMASLNASSFSSASVSADGYTRFNNNKNNSNWGLCRITTAGTPSAAGYCTYSSDASIGIYEATINDGVNRVHCNAAGYANPNDELEHPVHFRNVNGGTTHVVATNVHGVDVNITLQ